MSPHYYRRAHRRLERPTDRALDPAWVVSVDVGTEVEDLVLRTGCANS